MDEIILFLKLHLMKCIARYFFFVFIFCSAKLESQYVFSRFNASNSEVKSYGVICVEKDKQDQIWFGTSNGLYRYDGVQLKSYHSAYDTQSLRLNIISDIYCDKYGEIWVSTGGYLHKYNRHNNKFIRFPKVNLAGYILFSNQKEDVILVNDFLKSYRLNVKTGEVSSAHSLDPDTSQLPKYSTYVEKDTVYYCTAQGLFRSIAGEKAIRIPSVKHFKDYPLCEKIVACDQYRLLITTWGCGYFIYDKRTQKAEQYFDPKSESDISFGAIKFSDSIIWVGTTKGIIEFNFRSKKSNLIPTDLSHQSGLYGSFFGDFVKDHQGNIWIASNSGLEKFDVKINNFKRRKLNLVANSNFSKNIISYYKDKNGNEVIGTVSGFAFKYVNNEFRGFDDHNFFKGHIFGYYLTQYQNKTLGSIGHWLVEIEMNKKKIIPILKFPSNVSCFAKGWDQSLWIGTESNGMFRIKDFKIVDHFDTATSSLKLDNNYVSAIAVSEDSILVIGHVHSGLTMYHMNSQKHYSLFKEPMKGKIPIANKIEEHYFPTISYFKDKFYIATRANGLMILSKNGEQKFIDEKNSQLSKTIYDLDINYPYAYIKASNGFYQLNLETKKTRNFLKEFHYIHGEGFNFYIKNKSEFTLAYKTELYEFNLENDERAFIPITRITNLLVNDRNYPRSEEIELGYNENYIKIEFSTNSYSLSQNNRFLYRINGAKWMETKANGLLEFPNLAPGFYEIEIKTETALGLEDINPAKISFTILSPFYKRWWFIIACILCLGSIFYIIYKLRLEKEMEAMRLRNNISRDLHDDIGSTLSAINVYSSILKSLKQNLTRDHTDLIEKISSNVKDVMEKMDDIVWSINPQKDDGQQLVQRIRAHTYTILSPQNVRFEVEESFSSHSLRGEVRKQVFLIFKEALNNAIKYSKAKEYKIQLYREDNQYIFQLFDDGVGFEMNDLVRSGNGLENMKQRAQSIGGRLTVYSQKGQGTCVRLEF
jgi:signal transduction histidine kinase/ligand-binding sensor domain-containing protein